MKTQALALLALALASATATITAAGSPEDVIAFTQKNTQDKQTYCLYFAENDKEFFEAITGLFSQDKETDFLNRMQNTDEFNVLRANVANDDLKKVADGMKITTFPYAACYFNGDVQDVIAGPADEDTAQRILEHKNVEPEPEPEPVPEPEPTPPPKPAPKPAPKPKPQGIKDLNRPIETSDEWKRYPETLHTYDYIDPINLYVNPGARPVEYVAPTPFPGTRVIEEVVPTVPVRNGPIMLELEPHHAPAEVFFNTVPAGPVLTPRAPKPRPAVVPTNSTKPAPQKPRPASTPKNTTTTAPKPVAAPTTRPVNARPTNARPAPVTRPAPTTRPVFNGRPEPVRTVRPGSVPTGTVIPSGPVVPNRLGGFPTRHF